MPAPLTDVATHLRSISASPHLLSVLARLHAEALAEPPHLSGDAESIEAARHKFVALDPDKCAAVYLLLRGAGARVAIEAGTSFGVSTAYLALAVGQNVAAANAAGAADGAGAGGVQGKVIGTELEAHKAAKAREHWRSMGEEVEPWIELREGDLRETLKEDLPPEVDFLLVDSESSLPPTTYYVSQWFVRIVTFTNTIGNPLSLDTARFARSQASRATFQKGDYGYRRQRREIKRRVPRFYGIC